MSALLGNGRHALADALDICTAELEMLLGRIGRNDPVIVLERESDLWWTVTDTANGCVMMRADRELCIRFMRRFLVVHPEARTDRSEVEHSWRVAQQATSNVVPLFHAQADEASRVSARKYEVSFRAELTDRQVEALADTLFEMGYDDLCFRPLPTLDFEDAVVRAHHSRADTTADRDALRDALQHETQRGLKW